MKIKSIISILLLCAMLFTAAGCSDDGDSSEENVKIVLESDNFVFTDDMALYMFAYTRMMLDAEFSTYGVDDTKPLSEQMRTDDESFADYLYRMTLENIKKITLYCEAASKDEYVITEGLLYKANESISYLGQVASDVGMSIEEYITELYGDGVTREGLETCTQMMTLCEGYEISLKDSHKVSETDISAYAGKHGDDFRKFDALRFTTVNKVLAEQLAAATSAEEFLKIMDSVSGYDLTDSDKNDIPDFLEVNDAVVSTDTAGEFASRDGAAAGDTVITEKDGFYIVTLLLNTPAMDSAPTWDYRMVYITTESSTDPYSDASSLRDQWIEKKGGEEGFANIASRYSDHPTAYYGGLISGAKKDELPESVATWLTADDRKEGDSTMAPGGDDAAFIIYYKSGNTPRWKYEVTDAIKSEYALDTVDKMKSDIEKGFDLDEELLHQMFDKYQKQVIASYTANMIVDTPEST